MVYDKGSFKLQALRSANEWSLGKIQTENSIYQAYIDLIQKSERYIYIENQFFISSTSDTGVKNQIAQSLVERIKRAISERAPFKVIVFMPLMPAFEANLEEKEGPVMQIQIGLQNQTINKGENSMLQQLRKSLGSSNIPVENYVQFCSLRTWQKRPSDQTPMTELIYIHSKVACSHRS
jgi:phospholipase D1/2